MTWIMLGSGAGGPAFVMSFLTNRTGHVVLPPTSAGGRPPGTYFSVFPVTSSRSQRR